MVRLGDASVHQTHSFGLFAQQSSNAGAFLRLLREAAGGEVTVAGDKLYTMFCECGWQTDIGDDGQEVDDFLFRLRAASGQSCPDCGERKLFIKNKQKEVA